MNLEIFKRNESEIRGGLINNEPYFVLSDVCKILDIDNPSRVASEMLAGKAFKLKDLLKPTESVGSELDLRYDANLINEQGLYALIFRSRTKEAEQFQEWVTSEVLPSIRKHGAYLTPQKIEEALLNPDTIIKLAQELKIEREKRANLEKEATQNTAYVSFAKSVEASVDSVLIGNYAKLLSDSEGVRIGQNSLFEWLRENGYLITGGARHNVPYQRYIDNGYFEVTTQTFAGSTGAHQRFITKITGKGQIALSVKIVEAFKK
ncbi:MAG: phage antirepressor [Campylobacter sp.]